MKMNLQSVVWVFQRKKDSKQYTRIFSSDPLSEFSTAFQLKRLTNSAGETFS